MTKVRIELQKLTKEKHGRPHKSEFKRWFESIINYIETNGLRDLPPEPLEITVRIVEEVESTKLNTVSRSINKPTNVLSFPFEAPVEQLQSYLGDIVLCGPIIQKEAQQMRIEWKEHWAHMFIHGTLHLFGFDHDSDSSTREMQQAETVVMHEAGYPDPWAAESA